MNMRELYNRLQRFRLPLGSLRAQLAVASAVVALVAVLMVTLASALSISISFGQYRRNQISTEVHQLASTMGRTASEMKTNDSAELSASILLIRPTRSHQFQQENLWAMNQQGNVLYSPPIGHRSGQVSPSDAREIATALYAALGGHSSVGSLPYTAIPWLSQRYFAAAPIQLGSSPGAPIIGAVALSSLPRADLGVAFFSNIRTTLFLTGLATALLAALGAIIFSRRLTSPVDHLAAATARMTGGDYSARVDISAPDELRRLAMTFNDMAAALERDVNELHRQERLRRDLVANISHELATPLTAIQGYTEALADGVIHDPAGREESTRMIARESARLRRLVDQLRQVALFEAGAQRLDAAPLQLAPVVADTLEVLAPALERKHITVINSVTEELPTVNADSDRLIEILLNLFDNALRHTPDDGKIRVGASRVGASQDGEFVRISIADSGAGIAAEDRERIFDRFYRLDTSRSTETGGSGLGLSIVRALVEAHGGHIQAGAAPDGGAEFTFTLPVAAPDQRIAGSTAPVPALR